jgi:uncharacterized protein YkwD
MKKLFQFFIIVILFLCIYLVRDDIKTAYTHAVASFNTNFSGKTAIRDTTAKLAELLKPYTPGPLRVDDKVTPDTSTEKLTRRNIILLTNQNRKENGDLKPLVENSKLDASAQIKMKDMFAKQYFEHVSPSGVGIKDLAGDVSYQYMVIGENLAEGDFTDDKDLVDHWMNSPGHRANILNKNYTEIGVAVAKGMFQGRIAWMAVQHFGAPRSVCPQTDEVLHGEIKINDQKLAEMQADLDARKKRIDSGAVYEGKTTNEQKDEYNAIVKIFNELVLQTRPKKIEYNKEVVLYNACVEIYKASGE